MWTTWWFEVIGANSNLCGEEFFVEVNVPLDTAKAEAIKIAVENFPNEVLQCHGRVSQEEAEMMGFDTY